MKLKNKTLIVLIPAFPESGKDMYIVLFGQLMVKSLKENFPELHIVVLSFFYPSPGSYQWNNIHVVSFGNKKTRIGRFFSRWRIWQALKRINREKDVIGIFSFWCTECALTGNYFSRKTGVRHLIWICGQDARKTNKWVRFIRPEPDQLVGISDSVIREFEKNHGIRPTYMIPNAIDPRMFSPDETIRRDIDILGAGSLIKLKQYDVLIRIAATLKKELGPLTVQLSGEGEEKEPLGKLNQELNSDVSLLGSKPHEELLGLMQRTKIFLHPSTYEGCSTVCLEALYAGAHVISFTYPFNDPVTHWHVVKNEDEMKAKAAELLMNDQLEHFPVLKQRMTESANALMKLFEHR